MVNFLKVVILIFALFLMFFPLLPFKAKRKKFSTIAALRYEKPLYLWNLLFVILAIVELVVFVLVYNFIAGLGDTIANIPIIGGWLSNVAGNIGSNVSYVAFAITVLVANLGLLYTYVILKTIVKAIMDKLLGIKSAKSARKNKPDKDDDDDEVFDNLVEDEDKNKKNKSKSAENVPVIEHIREKQKGTTNNTDTNEGVVYTEENPRRVGFLSKFFFESPEYWYAKPWVTRMVTILQWFVWLTEAFFLILFGLVFAAMLFPVPRAMYDFLINFMRVQHWYVYPFLSLIILQEICNALKTELRPPVIEEKDKTEEEKIEQNKLILRGLASDLKKYFDKDHKLRFYPGMETDTTKFEYQFTNGQYKGALEYIKNKFADKPGNRGQSYLEFMDAMYNEEHVYFCASFYSEIGEYIIAYTYTRLLSGARMIFIVNDKNKRDAVRKYILKRLTEMTSGSKDVTWRVYTSEDRLDQADVLVASPDDFKYNNIVENYPDFFEEACNAVFIDADRVVSLESYLCPVLAIRLLKATSDRIRFVFLSTDLLRGFAASSLPKLFCVDKVLSFSSASDNESVEYTLWNKESLKNRIYYKYGQKLMSLEGIIAEKAYKYHVDGIRLFTSSPIDHSEREILTEHGVEINEFYKDVPNINYMIYSDERSNLAAAIYACTRFKGKRNSAAQIISKPYLLREYFMSKATKENFIKRSSYIQPRITEHVKKEKLSLLKIFCRASSSDGMGVSEFVSEMRNIISLSRSRGDASLCAFCDEFVNSNKHKTAKLEDFARYLIAALCDTIDTPIEDSLAHKAKDYYIIVDHVNNDIYALSREKYITFRKTREVFERVYACNKRVALRLNDSTIGYLDTFPSRVPLMYTVGQSIVYNNVEYEIEQISQENDIIFLRRENVTFKNTLDTVFLRRYKIKSCNKIETTQDGVLNNSESLLKEIKVSLQKASFVGETYGFYNLMSNNQSLNFVRGVEGNPHFEKEVVERNSRVIDDGVGRVLRVTLTTGMDCTDGMRLLCAAAFNEFIKTMFPMTYRCIAICPILEEPFKFNATNEPQTTVDKIATLYPYIMDADEQFTETNKQQMQFLFINDCVEDVGVFDWFYDKLASNLQELIINVYSYLFWLKSRPDLSHYIYFGMDHMPECYDLEGACQLFESYNIIISDDGEKNYETAGEGDEEVETRRCSFCHKLLESGRYSYFDEEKTLLICADCMDLVCTEERLNGIYNEMRKYLETTYPDINFGRTEAVFASESEPLSNLNEWYFRINPDKRRIVVGFDFPERNTKIAVLLGMIAFWQYDNNLMTEYSNAQLSYEQLKYLRTLGETEMVDKILESLSEARRQNMSEIEERIHNHTIEEGEEEGVYNSFSIMRELGDEVSELGEEVDYEDIEGEDFSDGLYDPNKTPRFWKRYFRLNPDAEEPKVDPDLLEEDKEEDLGEEDLGEELVDELEDIELDEDLDDIDLDEDLDNDDIEINCRRVMDLPVDNAPRFGDDEDDLSDDGEEPSNEDEQLTDYFDELYDLPESDEELTEIDDDPVDLPEESSGEPSDLQGEELTDDGEEELVDNGEEELTEVGDEPVDNPEDPAEDSDELPDGEEELFEETEDPIDDPEDPFEDPIGGSEADEDPIDDPVDDPLDDPDDPDKGDPSEDKDAKKRAQLDKLKEKQRKLKEKQLKKIQKGKMGLKVVPYELEEEENPAIRLYNEIARHYYNFDESWFSREGVSDSKLEQIHYCVLCDYPEIFWSGGYSWNNREVKLNFRCKKASGELDLQQITQKLQELRKGAKFFTRGITKRTDPYKAMLTIYKRLILTLDYDTVGLNEGVSKDLTKDDRIRSLHSALVRHKTVCAGYAVAMQYLCQQIGLPCAYVSSEAKAQKGHAFNIVKIGKFCYYVDVTWGDRSDTKQVREESDIIDYEYCCVPYSEFIKVAPERVHNHIPNHECYPWFNKELKANRHEYYRYRKAYVSRYNEEELANIFAYCASHYNAKEDGRFQIGFRCTGRELADHMAKQLANVSNYNRIVEHAKKLLGKNKKAAQLFDLKRTTYALGYAPVVQIFYGTNKSKGKSTKK